jgi:5-hydroxyisourate hydrolase
MDLLSPGEQYSEQIVKLQAGGQYKIVFETKDYFDKVGKSTFYPWVEVCTPETTTTGAG